MKSTIVTIPEGFNVTTDYEKSKSFFSKPTEGSQSFRSEESIGTTISDKSRTYETMH